MEIESIEWHKGNLKNSSAYEDKLLKELMEETKRRIKELNRIAYDNTMRKFALKCANEDGLTKFTDKYNVKAFKNGRFNKNLYSFSYHRDGIKVWAQ